MRIAFENGAAQITAGSVAQRQPELFMKWLEQYGPNQIILGADSHHRMIATQGWQESSEEEVVAFIERYYRRGVRYVIPTDIAKDGMLQGPSTQLYQEILDKCDIKLIASGGISSLADLETLQNIGCKVLLSTKPFMRDISH